MPRSTAVAILAVALLAAGSARAADIDALRGKVSSAQDEAAALGAEIRDTQERLAATEAEANAAAARERRLTDLLAHGRERAARLAAKVERAEEHLKAERQRLRRARRALADRLVAIYMSGLPSTASIVLGSGDIDELEVRTEYLERIETSDSELAARVEEVRDEVRRELKLVAALKARVDAYNEELAAARAEIAGVRSAAEAAAARLDSLAAARSASLAELRSRIGEWVEGIEAAEAASREAAEETVGRWLGGPYSIPTYIVMCESGGNYSALNPSSGAGGAYQILPSTWDLYGGQGEPQNAPKAEQDRIAAEIWADSGGSAWVCAG
ncbi:MAG TPA: transglycosylase family protein [Solirubrobacterales bacterium]|nr:transglycosylase family protein [Solirubrobacterales bacterium]